MKLAFLAPVLVFFILIIVMMVKLVDSDKAAPDALINQELPEIHLPAIYEGTPGIKNDDLKGGYGLLNIFASWCVSCKVEHQFLMSLKEKAVLPIYGIAWKDNPKNLAIWLNNKGNPYKAIGADDAGKTIIDLGVTGAPETFLVSPSGVILVRYAGALNENIWNEKFQPIMDIK